MISRNTNTKFVLLDHLLLFDDRVPAERSMLLNDHFKRKTIPTTKDMWHEPHMSLWYPAVGMAQDLSHEGRSFPAASISAAAVCRSCSGQR